MRPLKILANLTWAGVITYLVVTASLAVGIPKAWIALSLICTGILILVAIRRSDNHETFDIIANDRAEASSYPNVFPISRNIPARGTSGDADGGVFTRAGASVLSPTDKRPHSGAGFRSGGGESHDLAFGKLSHREDGSK